MNRTVTALILTVVAALLGGCAHPYVLKLQNGTRIVTPGKPKLDHGYYVYKDAKGEVRKIPAGRVREMEPASMAESEKEQFKISTQKK